MRKQTRIQRKPQHGAAQDDLLNTRSSPQTTEEAPFIIHQVLDSPGQALDDEARAFMEPRFGHDFSQVRVHTNERAVESAQAVDALAYTVGNDIVFNQRQYAPDSQSGKQLLAHELTHVVQQQTGDRGSQLKIGPTDDRYEQEAAAVSAQVVTGSPENEVVQPTQENTVSATSSARIQRAPDQTTKERLTQLENRERVLEKRQAAMELDLRWRAKFGERIASYRQSILRISGGMDAANQGFQSAQMAQAQTDALETQLIGAALSVGFAASFEWIFGAALGKLGVNAGRAEKIIEAVENPANAAVSAGVNVAGVITSTKSANEGQTPSVTPGGGGGAPGGAMAFLTSNLEMLEHHSQQIEQAFIKRATSMQGFSDEQWEKFDPTAQEATYQNLLNDLNSAASGVESLKPPPLVAQVLERHLWALWLRGQRESELKLHEAAMASGSGYPGFDESKDEPQYDVGTDIEVRLNQIGVSGLAGVTLTGHWYSSNSPGDWRSKLLSWANSYNETLKL